MNPLANGIFVFEVTSAKGFIDDRDFAGLSHISWRKSLAFTKRNPKNTEVIFAAKLSDCLSLLVSGFPEDLDFKATAIVGRVRTRCRNRGNTRNRRNPGEQRAVKGFDLGRSFIAFPGKREARRQDVVALETERHVGKRQKATDKKSGCENQSERKCNLDHSERVAQTSMTGSAAETLARIAKRILQIAARRLQRGDETKDKDGAHADRESKDKDYRIHFDDCFRRDRIVRHHRRENLHPSPRKKDSKQRSAERKQKTLN